MTSAKLLLPGSVYDYSLPNTVLYVHTCTAYINMLNCCFVSCNLYVGIDIECTCVCAQRRYRRSSQNYLHFDFMSWCSFVSYYMYFMMCKY